MKNSNVECLVTGGEFMALLQARTIAQVQLQLAKDARDTEKNELLFMMRERYVFSWQGRLEALEFVLRTLGYDWAKDTAWHGDNDDELTEVEVNFYDE